MSDFTELFAKSKALIDNVRSSMALKCLIRCRII